MSPHQLGYYHLLYTQNGGAQIKDPGDAATFHIDKSLSYCMLTVLGGETRLLPTPNSVNGNGVGTQFTCTVSVNTGTSVAITDTFGNVFTLTTAGDSVTFTIVDINGTKKWLGQQYLVGVTSSAAEINITDGLTATAAELNASSDASGRILASTATTVAIGVATHGGRVLLLQGTANSTYTYTLPAATGTGAVFTLMIGGATTTVTQGTHIITVTGDDTIRGVLAGLHSTTTGGGTAWITTNGTTITLNHATKGGIYGDRFEFIDAAADVYTLSGYVVGSGTLATPIS